MSFEDIMRKRLADCGADACREVTKSMRAGRSLADAVLDAIEVLPRSETRDLRRWVDDWEAWAEWLKFASAGWRFEKQGRTIHVDAPTSYGEQVRRRAIEPLAYGSVVAHKRGIDRLVQGPSFAAVAAAAGVNRVKFQRDNTHSVRNAHQPYTATFKIESPVLGR